MDHTQKKSNRKKHKYKLLLGCFGFSSEHVGEEIVKPPKIVDTTNNMDKKPKKSWFSYSSFHLKSSGTTRTVPVDSPTTSGKLSCGKKGLAVKSKVEMTKQVDCYTRASCRKRKKSSSLKGETPVANQKSPRQIPDTPEVPPVQGLTEKPHVQTEYGSDQGIILGNEKQLDHVEAPEDATLHKRQSFCRKIDAIRTGNSLPVQTTKPKRNQTVTRSTSLPEVSSHKSVNNPPTKFRVDAKKSPKENDAIAKGYDSMVGISIVIVTLLIMLLWGRLCAILCTCAWFYFVPRLRAMVDPDETAKANSALVEPDFDSEEYKKRVVLEGFLERSHRPVV